MSIFCAYCDGAADYNCAYQMLYLFQHQLENLGYDQSHAFNNSSNKIGYLKKIQINSKIKKNIRAITIAKKRILFKTKQILGSITKGLKQSLKILDIYESTFKSLLYREYFCKSELPIINQIETFDIKVNDFENDEILNLVKKYYCQNLITCAESAQIGKLEFLNKYNGGFWCGAITNDNKTLVSGGIDSTIRIWDIAERKQKSLVLEHTSDVKCITLAKNFKYIISGSFDASVRIWDIQEESEIAVLKKHNSGVYAICYVEKESLIYSGDSSGELIQWVFESNVSCTKSKTFPGIIYCIVPMKFRLNLAIGTGNNIEIIDLKSLIQINRPFKGHEGYVSSIDIIKKDTIMVSGSWDKNIIIWDLIKGTAGKTIRGHSGAINSIAVAKDETYILSGSDDKTLRKWDMEGYELDEPKYLQSKVTAILCNNEGFLFLLNNSSIGQYRNETNELIIQPFLEYAMYLFLDLSAKSSFVGYGTGKKFGIWDMEAGGDIIDKIEFNYNVNSVELSKDDCYALICTDGKDLYYKDLEVNENCYTLKGHEGSVFCACFSQDGSQAASGSGDQCVILWNLNLKQSLHIFKGHKNMVYSINFINEKKLLVSAGADNEVRIWNLSDYTDYAVLQGHTSTIWKTIVTDDEKYIISGDFCVGIIIWDVDTKQRRHIFSFQKDASNWLNMNGIKIDSTLKFLKA